ncbi:MAG: LpxI family protein [Geminicoccaceae bacterium]
MPRKLAVLAGRGPLPKEVIGAARGAGRQVFVLAFEGETDPAVVEGVPHKWLPLGALGRALQALHEAGAEDVVMIGPVRRPSFSTMRLDLRGLQMLAKLGFRGQGDDRLLRVIVEELELEGFRVVGADDLVSPLLAPEALMTKLAPDEMAERDISIGIRIATRLGELDVGQAVIVQNGLVLGVEAVEGTDRLLARCAELRRDGPGGILIKLKKPGQERRADLPTVGPDTVRAAANAGLRGIAVHAGHCLMIAHEDLVAAADRAGLFVIGIAVRG